MDSLEIQHRKCQLLTYKKIQMIQIMGITKAKKKKLRSSCSKVLLIKESKEQIILIDVNSLQIKTQFNRSFYLIDSRIDNANQTDHNKLGF